MSTRNRTTTEPNHQDAEVRKHVCIQDVVDCSNDVSSVQSDMPSEKTPLLGLSSGEGKNRPIPSTRAIASFAKMFGSTMSTVSTSVRHLKKSVGFLQGFSLIVGILIGSGVFISPSLVMSHTHDAGVAFIVWAICGFIALGGALCYCELGCSIKKAGGNYAYILEIYGSLPAFLCCWTVGFIVDPSATAAISLTFGTYVMKTFESFVGVNPLFPKLVAGGCIIVVAFINCWSIRAATCAQTMFTTAQVMAVTFIVSIGIWQLVKEGHRPQFDGMWNLTSVTSIGMIGTAMYNGLWAYDGWALVTNVTEEMANLDRNLFLSIITGIPFVIGCYMLINMSLLSALSVNEISASKAVAVTFIQKVLGPKVSYIMPIFVATSCYGAANGTIFAAARLSLAAGREGHLPEVYSMIHKTRHTPIPAVMMTSTIAMLMLIPDSSSLETLIQFFNFSCWTIYGMTIFGVLVLRYRRPDMIRPYKVWLVTPILMTFISIGLVIMPFLSNPLYPALAAAIIVLGVPFYFAFVYYEPNHPKWFQRLRKNVRSRIKNMLNLAPCSVGTEC